jgi:hypothetical protein
MSGSRAAAVLHSAATEAAMPAHLTFYHKAT